MSYPLRKGLSLPHGMQTDASPNDYRNNGNATVVHDSVTRWVKVWVDWNQVQGAFPAPTSYQDSWNQLAVGGNSALPRLDAIIKKINDDSAALQAENGGAYGIILCVDSFTPPFARPAAYAGDDRAFPADVSTNGYWGWFFAHLCARYKQGAAASTTGPPGNPLGAFISAIEVCNEPNALYHPQSGLHCGVAGMMKSAENLQAFWDAPSALLGPAVLDLDPGAGGTTFTTFTANVLSQLQNWVPRKYFGWSAHNYKDVQTADISTPPTSTRVAYVQALLQQYAWKGTGERIVWLTEGGSFRVTETEQQNRVYTNYAQMQSLPDVPIWTNHLIVDPPPGPTAFDSGMEHSDLSAKPLKATWYVMPAANTPL